MKKYGVIQLLPVFAVQRQEELKDLFELNKNNLGVEYDFEYLKSNTHLYCVYKGEVLVNGIYYFNDDFLEAEVKEQFEISEGGGGKMLFMNGFSKRKCLRENLFAIKETAKFYNKPIYSYTNKKTAKFLLNLAGFENVRAKKGLKNDFRLFRSKVSLIV